MSLHVTKAPEPPVEELVARILGIRAPKGNETMGQFTDYVIEHLTFRQIERMRKRLSMERDPLLRILGISPRNYERRIRPGAKQHLAGSEIAERALRLACIRGFAERVLEDPDAARAWLSEPQPGLAGRAPNDLLASEFGVREVESLLNRIEHGIYV